MAQYTCPSCGAKWIIGVGLASPQTEREYHLAAENKRLRAALEAARMPHKLVEEDHWFSCPLTGEGEGPEGNDGRCNCGADEHNRKIDAALEGQANVI